MKITAISLCVLLLSAVCQSQVPESGEEKWEVVLSHPNQEKTASVKPIRYSDSCKDCVFDLYLPAKQENRNAPLVVFLPEFSKNRSWPVYQSWGKLVAAHGLASITPDVDNRNYLSSIRALFDYIRHDNQTIEIERNKIALYISSHVPSEVVDLLLKSNEYPEIKTICFLYHDPGLKGPFRSDLPVLFIGDDQLNFSTDRYSGLWNEVQKSKAPWALHFAAGRPHFFDIYDESQESKRLVREVIYWWKNQLLPLPAVEEVRHPDRAMIASLYRADYKKAKDELRSWISQHPDDQYANAKLAMLCFMDNEFTEAEQAYRKVKNLHPVNMIDFAKVLLAQDKDDEGNAIIDSALMTRQVRRNPFASVGAFLYSQKKFQKGVQYFMRAVDSDSSANVSYQLAYGYAALGKEDSAIFYLQQAVHRGYADRRNLLTNEVFERLRRHASFKKIVAELH